MRRLYGPGLFVADEGHLGGRYFINPSHRVTLHVEIGTDRVIELLEYSAGIHFPRGATGPNSLHQAEARWLHSDESLGGSIQLGALRTAVVRDLGKPQETMRSGGVETLFYGADEASNPYVLVYEAKLQFRSGRLTAVSLYNGD